MTTRSIEERFWAKVRRAGADDCWLWSGSKYSGGYGELLVSYRQRNGVKGPRVRVRAHRFSFELHHGPITDGLCVCHRCDTPSCVNPAHLFLGTKADNAADKVSKGRQSRGESSVNAKLNAEQVRAIRADPRRNEEIAKDYGVYSGTISTIKHRHSWKHIA